MPIQDTTYIEVSLDSLLVNIEHIKKNVPSDRKIIAVVKDNAYGCGSIAIARTLEEHALVDHFAVAHFSEATALRDAGISTPVLIFGRTGPESISSHSYKDFIYTLNDIEDLHLWSRLACDVHFHLNIDTGMTRMGILPTELEKFISMTGKTPNCLCLGLMTHFACADEYATTTVVSQLSLFNEALETLRSRNIPVKTIHFSNSAASIRFGMESCTHIRPGIALYGCKPDPLQDFPIKLKPVLSLKSSVIKMKKVPSGTAVSYGGHYRTTAETWIATIPAGYAHGVPRYLSNCGEVLIGGKRYRISGNVTMDYIMVDAGISPSVTIGDPVVIIGEQGNESISPDEIAISGNTIGYEVLCNMGRSINRIYMRNGHEVMRSPGIIF